MSTHPPCDRAVVISREGEDVVLTVCGSADGGDVAALDWVLNDLIVDQGAMSIIVRVCGWHGPPSTGIREVAAAAALAANRAGGRLHLDGGELPVNASLEPGGTGPQGPTHQLVEVDVRFPPDDPGRIIVALRGEVDLASADKLAEATELAVEMGRVSVTLDLAEVSFFDSQGVAALIRATKRLVAEGGQLVVARPSPIVRRVLEVTSIDELVPIED